MFTNYRLVLSDCFLSIILIMRNVFYYISLPTKKSVTAKRDYGNDLLNKLSKTALPILSACNAPIGVSMLLWLGVTVRKI